MHRSLSCHDYERAFDCQIWFFFVLDMPSIGLKSFFRITVSSPKRLTNAALGRLQSFRMYGSIGMSASSLYIESLPTL